MLAALLLQLVAQAEPVPIGPSWFEYPSAAIRASQQGVVAFEAGVGANGRVVDCRVTASSGSAMLDAETCRQTISRGRFKPARDAAGNPVASLYHGKMNWSLSPG